jgi:hypothetical protein
VCVKNLGQLLLPRVPINSPFAIPVSAGTAHSVLIKLDAWTLV